MQTQEESYKWIKSRRYDLCVDGKISEEDYEKDLANYKKMIGAQLETEKLQVKDLPSKSNVKKRANSTSIAGLREKMLEELRKK